MYEQAILVPVEERRERFNRGIPRVNQGLQGVSIKVKDLNLLTRQKLCRKLDIIINGVEGDYQTLAGHLDMPNDEFQLISQGQQPTENVLRWWERKPEATVAKLRDILHTMGRSDCVDILDQAQVIDSKEEHEQDTKSNFFEDIDKEIGNLPNASLPLLQVLVKMICETQDISLKKKCVDRIETVLNWVFQHFTEDPCGIYSAEETLRDFLVSDRNPENVMSCIRPYTCILTVMITRGAQPAFNKDSLKQFRNYLKKLVKPPHFCPQSRTRRDVETVIEILSASAEDLIWLHKPIGFINCVASGKNSSEEVTKFCQKHLKTKAWYQHYLILASLHMQVVNNNNNNNNNNNKNFLQIFLQVIAYFSKKLKKKNPSYQWKFTLTVVDSLTNIATIVPELSTVAIVGDMDKSLIGLIGYFELLEDQKLSECIEIFYLYTRTLVHIENVSVRRLLLTGIFKELDVSSEEILKERLKRSQSMGYLSLSGTLHYGENSLIMSGCFRGSPVVAKCYKQHRDELIAKTSSRSAGSVNFANEAVILSYLQKRRCHSNIVHLCTYDEGLSVLVLQYVSQGCLLKFLRNRRTRELSPNLTDLLHMLIQIANALVYLEEKEVLHLGIKAENVLLGENYQVKLTGFQFSRTKKVIGNSANALEIVNRHLKWMDPERLIGGAVFHASDVWSFGVLMYEFLTFGCVPYNHPTSNPNHGDFRHKPMTAAQARLFVLRKGRLPKHPCIPETLFQVISDKCCPITDHGVRATAAEVRDLLQMQHLELNERTKDVPILGNMPPPPDLCFLKEDVKPGDYNPGADSIADQDEDCPFQHLKNEDFGWNEEIPDSVYDNYQFQETYTNADPENTNPTLCSTIDNNKSYFVVLEYIEFRDIKHAEKLRALNHSSLVKVLAVNRFGPVKLEMISQYFPGGNILAALLSRPNLRQHLVLYMKQAAWALIYLHTHNILHRELRAENILLENEMQIKVGRLGFSKEAVDVNATYVDPSNLVLQSACAADARWNSTEVVKNGMYSKESDYWSIGIVFWELSKASTCPARTSKEAVLPYKDHSDNEVYSFVKLGGRPSNPDALSNTLYDIYKGLWAQERKKRCSIISVLVQLESLTNESVSSTHEATHTHYLGNVEEKYHVRAGVYVQGYSHNSNDDAQEVCSDSGKNMYDVPKMYESKDEDGEDLYEGSNDVPKVYYCNYDAQEVCSYSSDQPKRMQKDDSGTTAAAEHRGMDRLQSLGTDMPDDYEETYDDITSDDDGALQNEELYEDPCAYLKTYENDNDGKVSLNLQSSGQDINRTHESNFPISNNENLNDPDQYSKMNIDEELYDDVATTAFSNDGETNQEVQQRVNIPNSEKCSNDESNAETESLPNGDIEDNECKPGCVKSLVDRWENMSNNY